MALYIFAPKIYFYNFFLSIVDPKYIFHILFQNNFIFVYLSSSKQFVQNIMRCDMTLYYNRKHTFFECYFVLFAAELTVLCFSFEITYSWYILHFFTTYFLFSFFFFCSRFVTNRFLNSERIFL